jgi:hypothetical protein
VERVLGHRCGVSGSLHGCGSPAESASAAACFNLAVAAYMQEEVGRVLHHMAVWGVAVLLLVAAGNATGTTA